MKEKMKKVGSKIASPFKLINGKINKLDPIIGNKLYKFFNYSLNLIFILGAIVIALTFGSIFLLGVDEAGNIPPDFAHNLDVISYITVGVWLGLVFIFWLIKVIFFQRWRYLEDVTEE